MGIALSNQARRGITAATVILITGLLYLDLMDDYRAGVSISHLVIEGTFWALGVTLIGCLIRGLDRAYRDMRMLEKDLARSATDAERLRAEAKNLLGGGESFERQCKQWQLSTAERDVALLLLKGFSYQQIASSRNAAEGTVRQQALSVYRKAGLNSRSELAAFFLEDLFLTSEGSRDLKRSI
jgi:DNA-binding CsgD family transcriptional regulator